MASFLQISLKELLLSSEDWSFLPETVLRTVVMLAVILIGLSILGKRGVRQLSMFVLVVIIALGSAAGDPRFYKHVCFLPAILVFVVVLVAYQIVPFFVRKKERYLLLLDACDVGLI